MSNEILPIVGPSFSLSGLDIITSAKNEKQRDIVLNNIVTPAPIYDGAIADNILPASQIGLKYNIALKFDLDAVRTSFGRQIANFTTGAVTALAGGSAIFSFSIPFSDTLSPVTFVVTQLLNTQPIYNEEIKLSDIKSNQIEVIENKKYYHIELVNYIFANHVVISTTKAKTDAQSQWIAKNADGQYIDVDNIPLQTLPCTIIPNNSEKTLFEDLQQVSGIRRDNGSTTDLKNDSKIISVNIDNGIDTVYVTYIGITEHLLREVTRLQWRLLMAGYSVYGKTYFTSRPIVFGQNVQVTHFKFFEWEEPIEGSQDVRKLHGWRRAQQFGQEAPPIVPQEIITEITDPDQIALIKNAVTYNWGVFDVNSMVPVSGSTITQNALQISDADKLHGSNILRYPYVNGGFSRELSNHSSIFYDSTFTSGEVTPNDRLFPIINSQNFVVDTNASGPLITESGVSGGIVVAQYSSLLYQLKLNRGARAWIEYESPGVPLLATQTDWSLLAVATTLDTTVSMSAFHDPLTNGSFLFSGAINFKKFGTTYLNEYINRHIFSDGKMNYEVRKDPNNTEYANATGLYGQGISHIAGVSTTVTSDYNFIQVTLKPVVLTPFKHTNKLILKIVPKNPDFDISDTYIKSISFDTSKDINIGKSLCISLTDNADAFNNNETDIEKIAQISKNIFYQSDYINFYVNQNASYIIITNLKEDKVPDIKLNIIINVNVDIIELEDNIFIWNVYKTDSEGKLIPLSKSQDLTKEETGETYTVYYETQEVELFKTIDPVKAFSKSKQVSAAKDQSGVIWMAYENDSGQINMSYSTNKGELWDVMRNLAVPFRVSQSGSYNFRYPRLFVKQNILYIFYSHNKSILYKTISTNVIDRLFHKSALSKELEKIIRNIYPKEVATGLIPTEELYKYQGNHYSAAFDQFGAIYIAYETDEGIRIVFTNNSIQWNLVWMKPTSVTDGIKIHNIDPTAKEKTPLIFSDGRKIIIYYIISGNLFRKQIDISLIRQHKDDDEYKKIKNDLDSIPVEFIAGNYALDIKNAIVSPRPNDIKTLLSQNKLRLAFYGAMNVADESLGDRKITSVIEGTITGYKNSWGDYRIFFRDQGNKIRSFIDFVGTGRIDDIKIEEQNV